MNSFITETDCTANSCSGRGQCEETLKSFVCKCNDGYYGDKCQKSTPKF